jgi:hypothetical protein
MKIKKVVVNNRRKAIEIDGPSGPLSLPFSKLRLVPTPRNPISRIKVDPELAHRAITYWLESGDEDSVHLDAFLEYNRDPELMRELVLHQLSVDARKLMEKSGLSKHEVIRRLGTSPSQLYRLLDTANYRKSVDEMLRLLAVLGATAKIVIAS